MKYIILTDGAFGYQVTATFNDKKFAIEFVKNYESISFGKIKIVDVEKVEVVDEDETIDDMIIAARESVSKLAELNYIRKFHPDIYHACAELNLSLEKIEEGVENE